MDWPIRYYRPITILYEFFRGSHNGFTADKFHKICDNYSSTVTIIKVKDSNEILGGYKPIMWRSDYSVGAAHSFRNFKDYIAVENFKTSNQ